MFVVCRTCLSKIHDTNYISLTNNAFSEAIKSQLAICVPEMALNVVKEPIMCNACVKELNSAFNFKCHCLQSEEQIQEYRKKFNWYKNSINLKDMLSDTSTSNREILDCTKEQSQSNNEDLEEIDPEMPALERMDQSEDEEEPVEEVDDGKEMPTLPCQLFQSDNWSSFEMEHLGKVPLRQLTQLCKISRKERNQISSGTNKPDARKTKDQEIKKYNKSLKDCIVLLNRDDALINKQTLTSKGFVSTGKINKRKSSQSASINKENNVNIKKTSAIQKTQYKKEKDNSLLNATKSRNKRNYKNVVEDAQSSSEQTFKCSICNYGTNIEIDMELHSVVHVIFE